MKNQLIEKIDSKLYFSFLIKVSLKKYIFIMLGMIVCVNRRYYCTDIFTMIGASAISFLLFLFGIIPEKRVRQLFISHNYIKSMVFPIIGFIIIVGIIITVPSGAATTIIDFLMATIEFFMLQNNAFRLSILEILESVLAEKERENDELQGRNSD